MACSQQHRLPGSLLRALVVPGTWDALHGMWPAEIVRQLRQRLPRGYVAAPTVHPGSQVEVDVATYERDDAPRLQRSDGGDADYRHLARAHDEPGGKPTGASGALMN